MAAVGTVAFAIVLSGCGSNDGGNTTGEGSAAAPRDLVWAKSFDVESLDPSYSHEVTGFIVHSATYDRLVQFEGSDPELKPMVAEEWTAARDQRTFTFRLRDDVRFSDGTPLTANDVVFTIERLRNVQGSPAYRAANIASVKAPDGHTVVVTTSIPFPGLPASLASSSFGILNSKVVKAQGGTDGKNAARTDRAQAYLDGHTAGSGPYVLASYDRRARIVLRRNPDYWNGEAGYDSIILKNVPTENQLLELQRGTAQLAVDLSPTQVQGLDASNLQIRRAPAATTFFMVANADPRVEPTAANKDVQEAVRYGLDYDNLVQLVGEGAERLPGVIPSMVAGKLPVSDAPRRDIERAKAALARSGIANPSLELEYANDFTLNGLTFGTLAQRIQSQLEEVGITVKLTPGPLATTLENWRGGREQLGLWTATPDRPAPDFYLNFCPGGLQALRVLWESADDPEIDRTCKTAATVATEDPAFEETYQTLQRQLNERGPFFPLFQPAQILLASDGVTNLEYSPMFLVDLQLLGRS